MDENPNKLAIELLPNGQLTVNGPIGNRLLCYGMLDMARDVIKDFAARNERRVLPVNVPLGVLKNGQG